MAARDSPSERAGPPVRQESHTVDLGVLGNDVLQTSSFLATPAILWLFLYLVAWEDPTTARESGFGRRTFWLLVPLGWLASLLIALPFFGWDGDILAINLAGGIFPLVLSGLFLWRLFGSDARPFAGFLGALALETAGLFAIVVLVANPNSADLAALVVCLAAPLVLALVRPRGDRSAEATWATPLALALTSGVIFLTFLTTQAVAGVGIESIFPFYLLAPIAAGVVAVPIVLQGLRKAPGASLSLAYATTTLGTLIGADVLRQPPLYGVGGSALFAIGGAGLLDLLYLSGLLSAAAAYGFLLIVERRRAEPLAPSDARTVRTPSGLLQEALALGVAGRNAESTSTSALAAESAALTARRLLNAPSAPAASPWSGLGAPPWVEADYLNLRALAAGGSADAVDAGRAWTTSHWLVRIGRELGQRRMGSAARRGAAFGLDLAVTLPFAVAVWALLGWSTAGGLIAVANSVPFVAAAIGYPAYAFVYLVVAEATTGTTLGKWAVGLEVTDRDQRRPGPLAVLIRNVPKLVPLELVGVGGAVITSILVDASGPGSAVSGGLSYLGLDLALLSALLVAIVLLVLLVGWAGIQVSPERQRVGDYLAGTWVLSRPRAKRTP